MQGCFLSSAQLQFNKTQLWQILSLRMDMDSHSSTPHPTLHPRFLDKLKDIPREHNPHLNGRTGRELLPLMSGSLQTKSMNSVRSWYLCVQWKKWEKKVFANFWLRASSGHVCGVFKWKINLKREEMTYMGLFFVFCFGQCCGPCHVPAVASDTVEQKCLLHPRQVTEICPPFLFFFFF